MNYCELAESHLSGWKIFIIYCSSLLLLALILLMKATPLEASQERVIELPEKNMKIYLKTPKVIYKDGRFEVSFEIQQERKADDEESRELDLKIPVKFYTAKGEVSEILSLRQEKENYKVTLPYEPLRMIIDEDRKLPRKLSRREFQPAVSQLFKEKAYLVIAERDKERYKFIIDYLIEKNPHLTIKSPSDKFDPGESYIFFGNDNPDLPRLFGPILIPDAGFSVITKTNPWNFEKIISVINLKGDEEKSKIIDSLIKMQEYSTIAITGGNVIFTATEPSQKGIEIELRKPLSIFKPTKDLTFEKVIEGVSDKKILYIGEYHDRPGHHYLQKRFIEELYIRNQKIAIGMEMFQRPFQQVLDDYINKKIEEKEFLKKTEYFKRWGFDYNLYKPILDLAREKAIPVIALNLKREIIEKVSRSGIESLTEEEKRELPEELDFSDEDYRKRLLEVFKQHKRPEGNFDYFYQSQILWDETMAMSVDQFLKKNPEYQLIVLAGGGHIAYGSGIPKRVYRRNGLPYSIILINAEPDKDIADFIIYQEHLEGITAPKLMVSLKEEEAGLRVTDMPEESPSRKAGIKRNDIIIKIDDLPVSTIDDLRIHLFYKKPGDTVKVTVRRRYFLLGEKEKEFLIRF